MIARELVLLHGWGGNAGVWRELAARLAPRWRVRSLDLPGYGTTAACKSYTLETLADAVARAAPRRCAVVGWSLGGQVALAWARRAPRQVERLALIATTPCFVRRPGWTPAMAPDQFEEFARALGMDALDALNRFALLVARGDAAARRVARRLREAWSAGGAPDVSVLQGGLKILRGSDLRSGLGKIRQPVLVIHGARDRLVPLAAGRELCRRLACARLLVQRRAAHAPFLSSPAAVAAALRAFLDD